MSTLVSWIIWSIAEILLTLILASIAPIFINSAYPWIGLLIWLFILLLWIASALWVAIVLQKAYQVRQFFLRHFPEERDRSLLDFTGLSLAQVQHRIADWQGVSQDPDFKSMNILPLDFIKAE